MRRTLAYDTMVDMLTCRASSLRTPFHEVAPRACEPLLPNAQSLTCSYGIVIKRIMCADGRSREERSKWGVELQVGNRRIAVNLGGTDNVLLYYAILLAQYSDSTLSRKDFTYSLNSRCNRLKWIQSLFHSLKLSAKFNVWYENLSKKGLAHRIDDAKSKINALLKNALSKEGLEFACDRFMIKCEKARSGSFYSVGLRQGEIIVPDMMTSLGSVPLS